MSCIVRHRRERGLVSESVLDDSDPAARTRRPLACVWLTLIVGILLASTAFGWNGVAHEVVARVAWYELEPEVRRQAVELLSATRPEVELSTMRPRFGSKRDQLLFERAATWPDHVRSAVPEENRPQWHYVNYFWKEGPNGPIDLPDIETPPVNVLSELPRLIERVRDQNLDRHERGVALAWVLHLVGDLHQPLHCSARVTDRDPRGDRGGNSFKLEREDPSEPDRWLDNLHSLWDGALARQYPRGWESAFRYRERLLDLVRSTDVAPQGTFALFAAERELDAWVREGVLVAQRACYPSELVRDRPAPPSVLAAAAAEVKVRMHLAGLRTARVVEAIFR